jgi:hypothetical protein
LAQALYNYQKGLTVALDVFGPNHVNVVSTYNGIAATLTKMGEDLAGQRLSDQAREHFAKSREMRRMGSGSSSSELDEDDNVEDEV